MKHRARGESREGGAVLPLWKGIHGSKPAESGLLILGVSSHGLAFRENAEKSGVLVNIY